MASAVWPAGLPQAPQLRSLREQPADLTVRTAMAVGPAKVRRRQTAGVRIFACELLLTRTQVETLDDFFYETIAAGALPFTWVHHRTGQTVDYRFTGPPEYVPLAPRQAGSEMWRTTFTLEALPGTLVTGDPPDPPPGSGGGGGGESLSLILDGGGDGGPDPDSDEVIHFEVLFPDDSPDPDSLIDVVAGFVVEDDEFGDLDGGGLEGGRPSGTSVVDPGPGETGGEIGGDFGGE